MATDFVEKDAAIFLECNGTEKCHGQMAASEI
jgi:hypothetical protein